MAIAATLAVSSTVMAAAFQPFVIRNASAGPNNPPVIQVNNVYVPGATEFIIGEGGQKAGLGSSAIDGSVLGSIVNLAISRKDDRTRFTAGSGPYVAPYFNIWITDGNGRYAVVANEPSDPNFQPLYANGYDLTWADLANKVAKVYENADLSWLPTTGSSGLPAQPGRQNPASANMYTFADLAGFIVKAPTVGELQAGWPGLGSGAPRRLGTDEAWGVNWIFGDTLTSYVSGAEGYVVAGAAVSGLPATTFNFVLTDVQANSPTNQNLGGVSGEAAPGFLSGSFAGAANVAGQKSEMYFLPSVLFGRAIKVGEVKSLSYWTKTGLTHSVDPRDWFLAIYTQPFGGDVSTPVWYGSRFGSEPYFAMSISDPANTWNQWTTGGANNRMRFFESTQGAPGATFGSYTDPDWATFLNANSLGTTKPRRNQEVLFFSIQTGSAWANGFTGKLDGLRIELTNGSVATVNFEAEVAPVAFGASVVPAVVAAGAPVNIAATIDDTQTGNSNILSAEFRVGAGPWTAMLATDGLFDSATEGVKGMTTAPAIPGVYSVEVRGKDAANLTSNVATASLKVFSAVVVIDGCDTGVANRLIADGFTISDLIAQCATNVKNHGDFVKCVADLTDSLKKQGLITAKEAGDINSCAGKSSIGK